MIESAGGTVSPVTRADGNRSSVAAPSDSIRADSIAKTIAAAADTRQNPIAGGLIGSRWSEWALLLCLGCMLGVLILVNFPAGVAAEVSAFWNFLQ